jgi:hypothetical protein
VNPLTRAQATLRDCSVRLPDALIMRTGVVTLSRASGPSGGSVAKGTKKISYSGYRFPPEIIHQAIWLYLRFTLSFRDVEDLLAERGITVSYSMRPCVAG